MSAWEKIDSKTQEKIKASVLVQVEDLVEDAADEIEEDTIEEIGENLWENYICGSVESEISALGYKNDLTGEGDFSEIWDELFDYYWQVYYQEVDKLFE